MFAQVIDGTITSFPKGNKGIQIGDLKYPKAIYSLWTESERNAIGIYTVIIDNTNFKDQTFYINTDQTYTFDSEADTVTASYGTVTAKAIADVNAVDEDGEALLDSDGNQVVIYGLKTKYKNQFNTQAAGLLLPTDWYVVKATEVADYTVPSAITTYRATTEA